MNADGLQFVKYIINFFHIFSKNLSFNVQELMQYFSLMFWIFFFFSF